MDRRDFLMVGSLAAAAMVTNSATVAHAAEPKVWLNMNQKELDDAYTRSFLGKPERIPYGRQMVEGLDLFRAKKDKAPVNIFIHGGAWKTGTAEKYSFVAAPFVMAGASCVIPDFSSVEDADGDLGALAGQLQRLVRFVYAAADKLGCDRERIYLSGHSSGAHLAAVLLTTDWTLSHDLSMSGVTVGLFIPPMIDAASSSFSEGRLKRMYFLFFASSTASILSNRRCNILFFSETVFVNPGRAIMIADER